MTSYNISNVIFVDHDFLEELILDKINDIEEKDECSKL